MIFKLKYKSKSNTELLQQYLEEEDVWAFQVLYERYEKNLWNMFWSKTNNREDCRDLMQQTYEKLLTSKGVRENSIQKFEGYLMGIAFNLLKQYYSNKEKAKRLEAIAKETQETIVEPKTDPSHPHPQFDLLWNAIRELSPKQQTAMEMHLSEMSYKEIANKMDTTETVVGSLLNRARKKLKELLEEENRS